MSSLTPALHAICADPMLDMISLVRSPGGGWTASVKRAFRGHNVHHDADPVAALLKALTAPALAPVTAKPAPSTPVSIEDAFG